MKRTARLVRRALEGRAPDPWIRGATDVAAAVGRSGTGSRHEAAAAAGPGGAVISSRDTSLTGVGALGGGSCRHVVQAAGGPGAISTRDIAYAAGGSSGVVSSRDRSHATAGGPGGITSSPDLVNAYMGGPPAVISSRDAAAGPGAAVVSSRGPSLTAGALGGASGRRVVHAAGGPGAISSRDIANPSGGPGAISTRDLALAAGGSGLVSSRHRVHAAGGPSGGILSRGLSHATAGSPGGLTSSSDAAKGGPPGTTSPRGLARAAGGPGAISSRVIPHAAGGIIELVHATGGVIPSRELSHPAGGVITSRELAHGAGTVISTPDVAHGAGAITSRDRAQAAGGLGGGSGHDQADAVLEAGRCSGRDGNLAVLKPKKRCRGERKATENLQQGLAKERKATTASLHAQGTSSSGKVQPLPPLAIHDKVFVPFGKLMEERERLLASEIEEEWVAELDVSQDITCFLTHLVGPIPSFRMDSSKWTDSTYLVNWLGLLSKKSVQEIDVLNLGHDICSRFPIECLESKNLWNLRIGFFAVHLDLMCFNYTALKELEFFACSLDGKRLSWVLEDCSTLEVLKVYYCYVDLRINSNTLQVLDCIGNIGNQMVVASAPQLYSLTCGTIPKQLKSVIGRHNILASIYLNDLPSLNCLNHLSLPHNKLLVNTKDIAKDAVPLISVEKLSISLEMFNSVQVHNLRKILESFPMLQSLQVKSVDNVGRDEGPNILIDQPFKDIGMVECVKNCLTSFSLQGFRAAESEMHLIKSVMKNAPNLLSLSTNSSESSLKEVVHKALKEIKCCEIASEVCQFSFD